MIPIKTVNVLLQWCSKIILGCFFDDFDQCICCSLYD